MPLKNDKSLVSVIIPVYNTEKYLGEAIESVLSQSYRHFEIIIIDDGSTDASASIAKGYDRVYYHYQSHTGLAAALNRGVEETRGNYLAFLDADDLWVENKLSSQMAILDKSPNVDMVFGKLQEFISPELSLEEVANLRVATDPAPGFFKSALLIRRTSFFKVGLFNLCWRVGDFVDWYIRAKEMGMRITVLPQVVFRRRIHQDNMGIRERGSYQDYARILKSALDRQRKSKKNE
jgi:glycosyltransferase involved in cell wall biosynthesis